MKIKLTILFFFVALGLYAQKQLQPYTYTLTEGEKTQTILIYATAEAVNSITFTLKNAKNEVLKNKEGEIKFKVFPFTEVSFRAILSEAILSIDSTKTDDKLTLFETEIQKLNDSAKRGVVVKNVRNIYQFFNALVNTAFQYDTEPVAGILKYNTQLVISKKQIQGKDTDILKKTS